MPLWPLRYWSSCWMPRWVLWCHLAMENVLGKLGRPNRSSSWMRTLAVVSISCIIRRTRIVGSYRIKHCNIKAGCGTDICNEKRKAMERVCIHGCSERNLRVDLTATVEDSLLAHPVQLCYVLMLHGWHVLTFVFSYIMKYMKWQMHQFFFPMTAEELGTTKPNKLLGHGCQLHPLGYLRPRLRDENDGTKTESRNRVRAPAKLEVIDSVHSRPWALGKYYRLVI